MLRRRKPTSRALDRALDTELFKALSDPTRLGLLACLVKCARPCSVSELAECCSVDFSVVTRHLAHLRAAGLVSMRKSGRTVWYTPLSDDLARRFAGLAEAVAACDAEARADACCPSASTHNQ